MSKERLLILDGHSLMYRAFYALPALTNSDGIYTNAVYGFTNMLLKMKEEFEPDYIVTTFDRKAPTFRHEEYSDYKAGRKKMPDELIGQFAIVRELLEKMAIDIFELDGFEADDLIGTLSVIGEKEGLEVFIVTGDRDALQLATDNVKVVINKKGMSEKEIYDRNRIIEDFGVTPTEFIDVKGLMGDASDNIPGVPGVGEKTAYKLIKEYKSIENVLMNIEKISGKKLVENLMTYSEQAIFSKKLATIITSVPMEIDLDSIKSKENYDVRAVKDLFYKLQFKSLIGKIADDKDSIEEIFSADFTVIDKLPALKKLVEEVKDTIYIIFDITNANVFSKITLNNIYLSYKEKNYAIKVIDLFNEDEEKAIGYLKTLFESKDIKKVSHSLKNAYTALNKKGIVLEAVKFDTELSAYLINSAQSEYSLETLIDTFLRISIVGEGDAKEINKVALLKKLYELLEVKIKEYKMEELLYTMEQPLTEAISYMEAEGFTIDKDKLTELNIKFAKDINEMESTIFALAGEEFNIKSPKQLGKILFEKLDLPVIKKTKTGYSTNAEVLEALVDKHPIITEITRYRGLTKIFSTYIEGLQAVIDTDCRIHSNFTQTVTTTGRLSSTEPNLQNIPIKHEMGRAIRRVFIPHNDQCVILSADYSQIELRVLAHISGDENLIEAFINHSDIHTKTASEVFNVPLQEVTSLMRSNAKAVNFGIVYGIGEFSLAKDINVSRKEAKIYIDAYFARYPKVKQYMEDIVVEAEKNNSVTTIFNRRRAIPEINSSNKIVQSFGKRLAMNTPIQGTAADIIKLAMVNVFHKLKESGLKSTLILQVHDELILNVYKDEAQQVESLVKEQMENVIKLSVPLEVGISIGETWYEAK
ncbi:DNA polymerase I [Clostridium tagluense]|uniref:DNA polymerase I n=1 Tax=Clostridium tagluense TaxID=360422 RepID=UPI001C0DC3FF|nr:DNA polymerase I [Clostridium tagluense]MBU3128383.1 DNA polymerase I [Clostridium tagluense]MCB2313157.1 DNA polymerase I [Clostridium tagluense]MCB2317923.1 DNA polymerase I [Clostridium tagluense]MCB2322765.1 DNA polymerase I [Clostridium tagluense]MCB2327763.1 DNA polymerase I [Clostridium tagluense]